VAITIRTARAGDLADIRGLLGQLGYATDETALAGNLARLAASGTDTVLVAADGARCVGLLGLHIAPMLQLDRDVARITTLVVDSGMRGHAIGRRLVDAAIVIAGQAGCGRMELTTAMSRADAHAFYRALGFDQTALRFSRTIDVLTRP
jgi:ribosomal protein S18 acetylase RimI-like enzyme